MTDPTADFDGCARECRKAGAHTLRWGGCEHATPPEPTVSMSKVFRDTDDCNSIGFDTYTVPQLAELIEPALRSINIRIGPNALTMLERGEEVRLSVGEYASMSLAAADAIVRRNDAAPAAAGVAPAADQTGEADALWDELHRRDTETDQPHVPAADQTGLRDRIAQAARTVPLHLGPNAIAMAQRGEPIILNVNEADALADAVLAVLPDQQAAIRAAALREGADAIDRETQQAKDDGVLEPDKFRPCRDASEQLRRMAAGAQQQGDTEARAVPLAASCAYCGHRYDEHNRFGCCVGNEVARCGCDAFVLGEKPAPVDPRTILGIDAPVAEQPAAAGEEQA